MSLDEVFRDAISVEVRRVIREELAHMVRDQGPSASSEYLTVKQAAELAHVHHCTVRHWIQNRSLPHYGKGRIIRIKRKELDALLAAGNPEQLSVDEHVARIEARRAAKQHRI